MKSFYTVKVKCSNCEFGGHYPGTSVNITKGKLVANHPCPSCGCKTLKQT